MTTVSSRKVTKILEIDAHSSLVTCVALGQLNGRVLATGGADCLVNLWVVGQKQPLKSLAGLPAAAECVKFDPTEESLVAGSSSGSIKIWDLGADKIKRTLTGHKSGVTALDFLPLDPNYIVSGSTDRQVRIWDLRRKACVISYKHHQDSVKEVLFSPHGKWITSAGIDGIIQVYQWQAGKLLRELVHAKNSAVYSLAFHPNDLLLASAGQNGIVKFWDLETFEPVSSTEKDALPIRCIRFQKDGSSLLAGCDDILRNFGWEPNTCFDMVPVGWGRVGDMAVSGNFSQLITASVGKTTVATYLVDLTRIRGKDSPGIEDVKEPEVGPIYKTLPRKLKDPQKRPTNLPLKASVRSQSREPISRLGYNVKAKEVAVDSTEVFHPKRQLNRSPTRQASPSSGSSSSPSRARRKSISPLKGKPDKPGFLARVRKNGSEPNVQVIRPLPKEVVTNKIDGTEKASLKGDGEAVVESKNNGRISMPFRKSQFSSEFSSACDYQMSDLGMNSTDSPAQYRAPVMPVYPVTKTNYSAYGGGAGTLTSLRGSDDLFDPYEGGGLSGATLTRIKISHVLVTSMMRNRLHNLRSVQQMWSHSDAKAVIDAAVRFNDPSIIVDVLNILCTKPAAWTLDSCSLILPYLHKLICHKHEGYIVCALTALKLILKNFATVIKTNLEAVPSLGVNISQEERFQKSRGCYSHILLLRDYIEKDNRSLSPSLRKECRQIKLLMQTLE